MFTDQFKQSVKEEVEGLVFLQVPEDEASRCCVLWAQKTVDVLKTRGVYACLQAGTAHWRIRTVEDDDGVSPQFFGYEWSPEDGASHFRMLNNSLPEMHVWAGIPKTNEVVDFTTQYISELAEAGGHVSKVDHPAFVWKDGSSLWDEGLIYHTVPEATLLAHKFYELSVGSKIQAQPLGFMLDYLATCKDAVAQYKQEGKL